MQEDHPLLINHHYQKGKSVSKSFLAILSGFSLLLLAATITLGVLYYRSYTSSEESKIYKVTPGDEVLVNSGFSQLAGKRVGLITNPTAVVNSIHIIDRMFFTPNNYGMELVALFGPEHGLRGSDPAGAPIGNSVDDRTGLPIYSLYGNVTAPTSEMLNGIDTLVFDIQDVGARFYTYISTLGLCMQSAAENNISFYVLDRPNPIGDRVAGWVLELQNSSFIGEYSIPVQYGLTIGELALMIQGDQLLPGLENLNITIIKMEGYTRGLLWTETALPWISPSPNIVDFDTALLYPGTGFFEAFDLVTEGRGTLSPFKLIGAPWANSSSLISQLQTFNIPGVQFNPVQFIPANISGMSGVPKFYQQIVYGVEIEIIDRTQVQSVELGVYLAYTFYQQAPANIKNELIDPENMELHSGSVQFYDNIINNVDPNDIIQSWKASNQLFMQSRKSYLIYEQLKKL